MAADNHTTIIGNLVEDPEVRFTNNGIAVANLRVAVTQRIQQDGQWRDGDTSFFKVNVWRGQAEHLADALAQGPPGDGHQRRRSRPAWGRSMSLRAVGPGPAAPCVPPSGSGRAWRGTPWGSARTSAPASRPSPLPCAACR